MYPSSWKEDQKPEYRGENAVPETGGAPFQASVSASGQEWREGGMAGMGKVFGFAGLFPVAV